MLQRIVFVLGLCCSLHAGMAQHIVLTDTGHVAVNSNLDYWRDPTGRLSVQQIHTIDRLGDAPGTTSPNFGFDRAIYWFRMDLTNRSPQERWLLEVDYAPLDLVDFYIQDGSGWIKQTAGDLLPIDTHHVPHRHPLFAFDIPVGQQRTVYLRIETTSSMQVPVHFWKPETFAMASSQIQIVNGLFYGAMLIMALYQLFLFFSIRDKITFYYVLTLLAMTNVVSFFQGYNFFYLHPSLPELNNIFAMFTGPLFILLSTLLTRAFLDLKRFSPLLDLAMLANMAVDMLAGFAMLVFYPEVSYKWHHYFMLSHCLLALAAAGYCLYRKYKPARYYLIAWITPLAAAAFFTVSNLGFIPGYLSTNYGGLMVGCILQMLFISFALGDRWSTLEKENRLAKELELKRGQEEKERLEKEVALRTDEIHQQNLQLEEVNNVKDKLFSVVSHDIRGPLSSLHLALTLAKSGSLSAEEFQKIAGALEVRLSQTTEFIDNLLQWARLQMRGETFEPEKLDLTQLAQETVGLLESECRDKKLKLVNNLSGTLDAFADVNMIRSVLRNLLTNAVKFTRTEGYVTVSAYRVDEKIIISVADTGVGIAPINRGRLFTLNSITTQGTRQEKGTGLGLVLCKEFVEKNGGKIWFETEEGKGTTFYFSLPQYLENYRTAQANQK